MFGTLTGTRCLCASAVACHCRGSSWRLIAHAKKHQAVSQSPTQQSRRKMHVVRGLQLVTCYSSACSIVVVSCSGPNRAVRLVHLYGCTDYCAFYTRRRIITMTLLMFFILERKKGNGYSSRTDGARGHTATDAVQSQQTWDQRQQEQTGGIGPRPVLLPSVCFPLVPRFSRDAPHGGSGRCRSWVFNVEPDGQTAARAVSRTGSRGNRWKSVKFELSM